MAWSKRCRFYNFPLSLKTRRLEVSSSSSALKSARSAAQLIPHMAPRVRARKRGHLDRALKAMAALSFPEKLVRDTVDELLEVYGGDHGWGFIEDASYSVLVDALLEKQQDGTEKPIASPQDHARSEHGPETSAVVPTCTPLKVVQSQTTQPLNSTPLTKIPGFGKQPEFQARSRKQVRDTSDYLQLREDKNKKGVSIYLADME